MDIQIDIDQEKIAAFCKKWQITELAFFGSVLREDFRPDSDVDVLVTFADSYSLRLSDLMAMEDDLKEILGHEVDMVERECITRSENYIRRGHILKSAQSVYVA
jgi:uncharacterized protein